MLTCKSLSFAQLCRYEEVSVGFGWDANLEGNFCILRSAMWEGSLDVENLLTNTICPAAGFGRLCPEGVFSNFWSWLHEIMNCNHVLAYVSVYKSLT